MKTFRIGVLVILILASCSKDEGTPDFVGESVGNYSYTVRVQRANNTSSDIITGTLSVSRSGDNLAIIIDEIETIKTSRMKIASDGYWFDMQAATIMDNDGNLVYREGKPFFVKDHGLYHGQYDIKTKQLLFNANYSYSNALAQFSSSAAVTATKK